MLTQLKIQNFGLIDSLELEFHERLNILTGETGAGKSIIIDALRIALGERVQASQLREASKACVIEAVFELNKQLQKLELLSDFLPDSENQLIIQRTFTSDGKNKIKINGATVTVAQLKEIGDFLVDFHGPHDHQMLLASSSHRGMLDRLVDFGSLFNEYTSVYQQYNDVKRQLDELQALSATRERELDLLTHQVQELEQVPLDEIKYQEILQAQTKLNNVEKLFLCVNTLLGCLDDDDVSVSSSLKTAFGSLRQLNQIDENTADLLKHFEQMQESHNEVVLRLREYADSLSFEPDAAETIAKKCDVYDDIKRKYGPTMDEAKKFYDEAKKRLDLLRDFEHNDAQLRKDIAGFEKKLQTIATKISKSRQAVAGTLKKTIEKELVELGMPHVKFEARVEPLDHFDAHGADNVTFYLSPNAGIDLKPLADIVSSGEAARVMLGLKKALIKVDPIPVLIFDEIDAQIGGRLGTVTGEKLRDISKQRQVLLITHLPQIASFADAHFKVSKIVKNGKALTTIEALEKTQRVNEIAQMMSGEKATDISLKHAKDMLASASR